MVPVAEQYSQITESTPDKNELSVSCAWIIRDILGPELGKLYLEEMMRNDERAANSTFLNRGIDFMNRAIERKRKSEGK